MKRLKLTVFVLVVLAGAAQFIRPDRSIRPTDPGHAIQAAVGPASPLPAVLDRSCADCHSNRTVRAWYSEVAPLSWLMARTVAEGREAVNFSEWTGYPRDVRRTLLSASCDDATSGRMPGPYRLFRPETKLSIRDIETICAAARQE